MDTRLTQLRYKEIVSISDGSRYGYVGDLEVDTQTGQVHALIIPGRLRLFGLLGREQDQYIPWNSIRRIGEDIILIEKDREPEREEDAGKFQKF